MKVTTNAVETPHGNPKAEIVVEQGGQNVQLHVHFYSDKAPWVYVKANDEPWQQRPPGATHFTEAPNRSAATPEPA